MGSLAKPARGTLGSASAVAVALLLAFVPAAPAAKRSVPFGFWGANWNGEITNAAQTTQEAAWRLMADTGVESQRGTFVWASAQPAPDSEYDFAQSDALMTVAAKNGIRFLPVVQVAPTWARSGDSLNSPPSDRAAYADYLVALIGRYGTDGTFWSDNPTLKKRAVRALQIWNEPSANYQWTIAAGKDWAPGYGKLLRASYKAIKAVDPGMNVVLAGLPNRSWEDLEHLYEKGNIHGYFDVAALHPYTAAKHGILTLSERFRAVMKEHGDQKKPLWITELGLPASKGKSTEKGSLQTDDAGMASFLKEAFTDLTENRHRLHIRYVHWYTWASSYHGWYFNFTGLRVFRNVAGQEIQEKKPAFDVYRKMARKAQGR